MCWMPTETLIQLNVSQLSDHTHHILPRHLSNLYGLTGEIHFDKHLLNKIENICPINLLLLCDTWHKTIIKFFNTMFHVMNLGNQITIVSSNILIFCLELLCLCNTCIFFAPQKLLHIKIDVKCDLFLKFIQLIDDF